MAQRLEAMEQWAMSGGAFSTVLLGLVRHVDDRVRLAT
ncbi:hypothetical protein B398_05655 [Xylella fastidiosa 32]|nr:hypothetical protein B398_05655 [Xylella fastidiosa 32]